MVMREAVLSIASDAYIVESMLSTTAAAASSTTAAATAAPPPPPLGRAPPPPPPIELRLDAPRELSARAELPEP